MRKLALALNRLDEDRRSSSVIAAFTASRSPNGTWSKPGAWGRSLEISLAAGGNRRDGAAVEGTSKVMMWKRSGWPLAKLQRRAAPDVHSSASAPELVKKTRSANVAWVSLRPSCPGRERHRGSTGCQTLPACVVNASIRCGWA